MKRRGRERGRLPVRAEINVTSLVDVAFTLLVIFIITAPVLQGGVEVNVPQGRVGVIEASENQIFVNILPDGSVLIGDTPVGEEDFRAMLEGEIRERGAEVVYVKGDSLAIYGRVFPVIGAVAAQEGVGLWLVGREIR